MAHELAHVVQGRGNRVQKQSILRSFWSSIWNGIKKIGTYAWNTIKSEVSVLWTTIVEAPQRIWSILKHIGSLPIKIVNFFWRGLKTLFTRPSELSKWLLDGIISGAAWIGRLIAKLLDLVGTGEVIDLLFQLIKINTRCLTNTEITEAKRVFGDSISYWKVRIDNFSLIAALGSFFSGGGGMGVTTFHTINFNRKIICTPGSTDMTWLIHELTHVAQYENIGMQYLGEALHAQATTGYNYGGLTGLTGKKLKDFNREQQAVIIEDYYYDVLYGGTPASYYIGFINDARKGDF
jgi:hypothetical protein